jgi:hypothetical protein
MTSDSLRGHPADLPVPIVATIATSVEGVDAALLGQAHRLVGNSADKDVVNQALAELIRDRRRQRAVAAELHRIESGRFSALQRPAGRP